MHERCRPRRRNEPRFETRRLEVSPLFLAAREALDTLPTSAREASTERSCGPEIGLAPVPQVEREAAENISAEDARCPWRKNLAPPRSSRCGSCSLSDDMKVGLDELCIGLRDTEGVLLRLSDSSGSEDIDLLPENSSSRQNDIFALPELPSGLQQFIQDVEGAKASCAETDEFEKLEELAHLEELERVNLRPQRSFGRCPPKLAGPKDSSADHAELASSGSKTSTVLPRESSKDLGSFASEAPSSFAVLSRGDLRLSDEWEGFLDSSETIPQPPPALCEPSCSREGRPELAAEFCDTHVLAAEELTDELPTEINSIQSLLVDAVMRTEGCSVQDPANQQHAQAESKNDSPAEVCIGADAAGGDIVAGAVKRTHSRKGTGPRQLQRTSTGSLNAFDAITQRERVRRRAGSSMRRKLSAAMLKVSNGNTLHEEDHGCVLRLFHESVPRAGASVKRVERVANEVLYGRWRSLATAEGTLGGGCEAAFYAPPDLALVPRLREAGLSGLPKAFLENGPAAGTGIRIFTHAAAAHRQAVASQQPKGQTGTYCICVSLRCTGAESDSAVLAPPHGTDDQAADDDASPDGVVVRPDRVYLAYMVHFQVYEVALSHRAALAKKMAEAERMATERQRASRAHQSQYFVACRALLVSSLPRLRCALDAEEADAVEARRLGAERSKLSLPPVRLVTLDTAGAEAEEVISLYLMGGGGVASRPPSPRQSVEGAFVESHVHGLRDVEVRRVENLSLFSAYCAQSAVTDAGFSPQEQSESPRPQRNRASVPLDNASPAPPTSRVNRRPSSGERGGAASTSEPLTAPRRSSLGEGRRVSPARAPRFQEHVIWHGARLKREDGVGASLEAKLRSIAEHGLDPKRCVKGATAQGGIWGALSPLAAFGRSSVDGRIAFLLCAAKTSFNEWVDTSCVRVLSRDRVLPLYIVTHAT